MAFNFNWSPLTADASFYTRAQELLTGALNKYPKPPIIVDDILVNELNLGSVPPDLEILEVGDLAEDRFRGIFKMCYSGDAFLTLKTRVQANPLNTYLSTRPSFASPEPLAASAGLTIPLKITLSEIKLSAFIILVFSKQKGLTLVFRNDPLESLKVSSTFDSIPFVRDYLQRTIEGQLRTLLMDEVPAIIHRLSLRLWVPEYREKEDSELAKGSTSEDADNSAADPLASPPQDPVDSNGRVLDSAEIESLSLDSTTEAQSLFSQRNLIRLATLAESQRTLSLFTPPMQDVVYRAWSGSIEYGDSFGLNSPISPPLSRKHSVLAGSSLTSNISDPGTSYSSRPTLSSFGTSFSGSSLSGKHSRTGRKRKHRVVNLRKPKTDSEDTASFSGDSGTMSSTTSEFELDHPQSIPEEREVELITPPTSPEKLKRDIHESPLKHSEITPRPPLHEKQKPPTSLPMPPPLDFTNPISTSMHSSTATLPQRPRLRPNRYFQSFEVPQEKEGLQSSASSSTNYPSLAAPFPYMESHPGGILEQAWMMKMAGEIARRVHQQKSSDLNFWAGEGGHEEAPPAYGS
ncbi:ERMES complex subunit [Thelotrema lepadinum]|nr:ERMES complex subunit [Thelotrema lepadinum]